MTPSKQINAALIFICNNGLLKVILYKVDCSGSIFSKNKDVQRAYRTNAYLWKIKIWKNCEKLFDWCNKFIDIFY